MARTVHLDRPIPLDRFPTTRVRRQRATAVGHVLIAAVAIGFSMALFAVKGDEPLRTAGTTLLALAGSAALVALVRATVLFTQREVLTLARESVSWRRDNCFGSREWSEQLASYQGILRRELIVQSGPNSGGSAVVQEVRLVHPDERHSIELFATREGTTARSYHEQACRVLELPALTPGLDGFITTDTEDVGRPLAELCKGDRLPKSELRLDRIPRELVVEPGADGLGVTIDRCEMRWYSFPVIACFPIALHWVCTRAPMPEVMRWVVFAFAIAVAVLLVGVFALDRIGRRRIELHRDRVDYFLRTPFGDLMHNRIDVHDMLSATVRRDEHGRPELAIESRDRHVEIGGGLPMETLEWLRALMIQNVKRSVPDGSDVASPTVVV